MHTRPNSCHSLGSIDIQFLLSFFRVFRLHRSNLRRFTILPFANPLQNTDVFQTGLRIGVYYALCVVQCWFSLFMHVVAANASYSASSFRLRAILFWYAYIRGALYCLHCYSGKMTTMGKWLRQFVVLLAYGEYNECHSFHMHVRGRALVCVLVCVRSHLSYGNSFSRIKKMSNPFYCEHYSGDQFIFSFEFNLPATWNLHYNSFIPINPFAFECRQIRAAALCWSVCWHNGSNANMCRAGWWKWYGSLGLQISLRCDVKSPFFASEQCNRLWVEG